MITTFAVIQQACGLSNREAADFLRVPKNTVDGWRVGRRTCPQGVIVELQALHHSIEKAANEALKMIGDMIESNGLPEEVDLCLSSDDHEARALGWPCVGAQAAVLGRVAAHISAPVKVVPSGAIVASAAAAD